MESVKVSSELYYTQRKRVSATYNPYNINFWEEVRKRWLVFGVLAAVALAVIAPRVGAPGGKQPACSLVDHSRTYCTHKPCPLHLEYLSYIPSSIIFFGAGARATLPRAPARALRLAATAALHAHVAAPALCVCAVTVFGAALHGPVISGALLSSVGSGCAWLSLALSRRGSAALVTAGCYGASLVATPLSALLLCGRTSIPPLSELARTWVATAAPFLLGCALGAGPGAGRGGAAGAGPARGAALALLYAECCARLAAAEGGLLAGDVLATLMLEVCWLCASACACAAYARWWGAAGARLIAICAVPKALDQGWGLAAACRLPALAALPGVFAAPAQALLLAALHAHGDDDADGDDSDGDGDDDLTPLPLN